MKKNDRVAMEKTLRAMMAEFVGYLQDRRHLLLTNFLAGLMRGFGFALGYERCALAIQAAGQAFPSAQHCDIFVACVDDSVRAEAFSLVQACRDAGVTAEMDHQHRSLKSQFKLADKVGSHMVAVLGPDELAAGEVKVRNMSTHHERLVKIDQAKMLLAQFGGEPFGGAHASIEDVFAGEE